MTLLPIVARELRVAARRRETYWTRLSLAILAIFIGIVIVVFTIGLPANTTGRHIFQTLAGLLFIYCLVYGRRATADSISAEKRDGTLGLLFLTDLKGHDIVLGKLAATSTRGFYGLMAVFPVLAIPLLLGGISNGEFWRMVLVLVNTFLFSLAVGILSSALSRDFRRAMGTNLLFFILLTGLPPAVGLMLAFFSNKPPMPELFYSCPAYSFYLYSDVRYGMQAESFWFSLGITHSITWLLVVLASWVVPRSWHDQPSRIKKGRWREFWRHWNYGAVSTKSSFRRRLLNLNPFFWLAARVRRKPAHVWTFLVLVGLWWLVGWLMSGSVWFDPSIAILTALMLNGTFKIWITIEAGQQLSEDKKAGAFELLLTAPLKTPEILHGQWLALRRQFSLPFLAVIIAELLLMRTVSNHPSYGPRIWLAGMLMLAIDMVTLIWVAMASALTAKSHNHATFSSIARVLGLPWALFAFVAGICYVYSGVALGKEWSPTNSFYVGLWFGMGIAVDAIYGLPSWWRLKTQFHQLALQTRHAVRSPKPEARKAEAAPAATGQSEAPTALERPRFKWPLTRFIKTVVACVSMFTILIIGLNVFRRRNVLPPPTVILVNPGRAPLKIFPTYGAALFVLPDGTLWRWGQPGRGSLMTTVPEQIGTNHDWSEAAACGNHYLGLRNDGTLWEWGGLSSQGTDSPVQVDSETNWSAVAASSANSIALKRDQTLWTWSNNFFNPLGNSPGNNVSKPIQVGTNNDWKAVACHNIGSYALKANGTLWTWGTIPIWNQGGSTMVALPFPTQVASETNWIGFANGFFPLFRSSSNQIWAPFRAPPNGNAPAAASCSLIASHSLQGGIAAANCDIPRLFHLRPDGTLWQKPYSFGLPISNIAETWTRVGKRSDWVSLWSSTGTAFGLTTDGTIWTWGYDPSQPPSYTLASWLQMIQISVRNRLAATPPTLPRISGMARYNQKEPRPLVRMVPSKNASLPPPASP